MDAASNDTASNDLPSDETASERSASIGDAHAQLASAASTLDELISRLALIAEVHRDRPDDELSVDLDEIERSLRSAARRLDRIVRQKR